MRRLLLAEPPDHTGSIVLGGRDFRYLVRVLRLDRGDQFRGLLPDGTESLFKIVEIGKTSLTARTLGSVHSDESTASKGIPASIVADRERREQVPSVSSIILCQALPKGQKMDLIVRQATEAGVAAIVPFVSRYSVPKVDKTQGLQKIERWNRIIKEARQQSGSDVATRIEPITDVAGLISYWEQVCQTYSESRALLLHQDPLAKGTLHGYLEGNAETVLIVVGPEGGFSQEEAAEFMAHNFKPLLLGANVLRTETAAIYAIAAVQVLLLEKASWNLSNR
ncbi:16S rRNA (uracil(1498)-N(3))-methyltransferase [Gracilinema caldarium]|uniref:RsmE family RNA methyltransferase n=1 Tax=Gracilinema caldarium TaxID=215591 RepID=UPI0026ECA6C1|nr:RsmE family RNA methyltransferase [Gracilinema caldarium]